MKLFYEKLNFENLTKIVFIEMNRGTNKFNAISICDMINETYIVYDCLRMVWYIFTFFEEITLTPWCTAAYFQVCTTGI